MTVPGRVAVLGGGRMGVGIAHAFLTAGSDVTVLEQDDASAAHAEDALGRAVAASVERGTTAETQEGLLHRATVTTSLGDLEAAGLVVEAVPENLALKRRMLAAAEDVLGRSAWLGSNTSSLSIDDIGTGLQRPERLVGLHFFNPVPASTLVEIVRGDATSPELVDEARAWVHGIGKTPIVVANAPGFASSRLGVAIALEAIRMLEDGVATAEDIDLAMVLGYKYPVGPLRLTDIVGLDVRLDIAEYLTSTLGERFAPPDLLREKVARGELGRKSGQGFFSWGET